MKYAGDTVRWPIFPAATISGWRGTLKPARGAARTALAAHSLNVAASRQTTGNHEIYALLEARLADYFGAEAALVFPDGYLAPIAAAQALAGDFTHACSWTSLRTPRCWMLVACWIARLRNSNIAMVPTSLACWQNAGQKLIRSC